MTYAAVRQAVVIARQRVRLLRKVLKPQGQEQMPLAEDHARWEQILAMRDQLDKQEAEIARLRLNYKEMCDCAETWEREAERLQAEIARLKELLRGIGANRYWEERWRDTDAENQKLWAALEHMRQVAETDGLDQWVEFIDEALAKEGK